MKLSTKGRYGLKAMFVLALEQDKGPVPLKLLSKDAKEITVGDVLNVLEGPVSLSDCILDEDICANSDTCVTKGVWERIKKGIEDVTYSITLQDMIDDNVKNEQDHI